jgi:phenylalanyl-tRNA synthetase beta subunit
LEEVPETGDFLIDLDILPNRSSDCMSYKGIAGEISALFNIPLKKDVFGFESGDEKVKTRDYISLVVEDSQKVKRATKAIAKNIKIKQSPQ